jgi:tetratricopeptide (TPR) repeat protein
MTYIVGCDAKSTLGAYGIRGFPKMMLIDPNGKIAWIGHPVEAEEAVEKLLKDKPVKAKEPLGTAAGSSALAKADKLYKSGDYAKALKEYEKLAKAHKSSDVGKKAKAKADKIKGDKEIMAGIQEADAKKKCENWLDMARALAKSGKETEAAKYYKRVIDEFPQSSYAETARRELSKLET